MEKFLFLQESKIIERIYPASKLEQFSISGGIFFFSGRLDEYAALQQRDLDVEIFFDHEEFTGMIPVVRATSPLFFSYLMNIHLKLAPHAGVEYTTKQLLKKMYPLDRYRHIITNIRKDCTFCRKMFKKTCDLQMAKHSYARLMIAPVFYNVMMDIAYGFTARPYPHARKTYKVYALIFVCILTSATNILVLEAIETQHVVNAIERHSARYGVPAQVFVDSGTQLVALKHAKFSIRDLDAQVHDAVGLRVSVSTPKAHEERGRVERKIRSVREMLEKTGVNITHPMTSIEWETRFAAIANSLDSIPMAKGKPTTARDFSDEILTPNRLKLGRNNMRTLHINTRLQDPGLPSDLLQQNRKVMEVFYRVMMDRVHQLVLKPDKWNHNEKRPPKIDDIVIFLMKESNTEKDWKLGRVIEEGERKVKILYWKKEKKDDIPVMKILERSHRDISILLPEGEVPMNSTEYFNTSRA